MGRFLIFRLPDASRLAKPGAQVKRLDALPQKLHASREHHISHVRRRIAQRDCQSLDFADTLKNTIKTG
ncbi:MULTISPECIES: hypothetical protein [Sinorhizobium]|uniref:Uncharacterized protein n=1 Tax=Sinorhizobium psoraleae TaxID=520838 RepID=A0ABT4KGF8_9HYPH|nr:MULTISPECIES: hypothetical protein [Sinorhizobium]MCZ4091041.1 hypothetical protein [Sinorhizobium psoraleae]MDK1387454.1 hypothetical protein [Sinorhizobium sp. 7-81]MDK1491004.1 hypothetical protein [Sinorhizobium sp. 8-89]